MHLVGFIIRICHDARSLECQIRQELLTLYASRLAAVESESMNSEG